MSTGKMRILFIVFIILNQVPTQCPVGLRLRLRMMAAMTTSSAAASAAPPPHSRAVDREEAEDGAKDDTQ